MTELLAVILAAGEGKRMKSRLPKTLHRVAGKPLLFYPVQAAIEAGAARVIVVASPSNLAATTDVLRAEFGEAKLADGRLSVAVQEEPRGTGDAVRAGLSGVQAADAERVLILCGDTPLLEARHLIPLLQASSVPGVSLALLTVDLEDPSGYGRILRDQSGRIVGIKEDRDLASTQERVIRSVNAGMYVANTAWLLETLPKLSTRNAQGEYYFTDVVALGAQHSSVAGANGPPEALLGVNDRAQLILAESLLFERIRRYHLESGVTVRGTASIHSGVQIGQDSEVADGVEIMGRSRIGQGVKISTGSVIIDSEIDDGAVIKPYSVVTGSRIGAGCQVGPFAHIRPESELDQEVHVGNFVEVKKVHLKRGAKANHLSYLGDGEVGEGSNIGAGTIFCNYDGYQKHRTIIGKHVFIGSDSQLVAPIKVGDGAFVATASTVTSDVPENSLVVGRVRPEVKPGYAERLRAKLALAAGKKP